MALDDYLKELGKQEVQKEKRIKIVRNPILNLLFKKCQKWLDKNAQSYKSAMEAIERVEYSSKDVKDLSLKLKELEEHKSFSWSGVFLSALINNSNEENFEVVTEHVFGEISWLGYDNKKNILVTGDCGSWTGHKMREGKITVSANTANSTGNKMIGGEILVKGSSGYWTGEEMSGGVIRVKGDVKEYTGRQSVGGKIYVGGNIGSIYDDWCYAKIYQKNKKVWPK